MRERFPLLLLCLLLVIALTAGCSRMSMTPPQVASTAMATQVDPTTKAPLTVVDHFPPTTKVMYLSARVTNPQKGTRLESRWYYDKQGKGQYALIDASAVTFPGKGDRSVAFSLKATDPFPKGAYKVQLLLDGQEVLQKEYRVE